jgi:hypothetical protein
MKLFTTLTLLVLATTAAMADRPVTEDERARLTQAVAAQGCSGGKMAYDEKDREFDVDDANCSDGKRYDLEFDEQYRLKSKKPAT